METSEKEAGTSCLMALVLIVLLFIVTTKCTNDTATEQTLCIQKTWSEAGLSSARHYVLTKENELIFFGTTSLSTWAQFDSGKCYLVKVFYAPFKEIRILKQVEGE
jgi:hypothetical protein